MNLTERNEILFFQFTLTQSVVGVSSVDLVDRESGAAPKAAGEAASELVSSVDRVESATEPRGYRAAEPVASPVSIVVSQPSVF